MRNDNSMIKVLFGSAKHPPNKKSGARGVELGFLWTILRACLALLYDVVLIGAVSAEDWSFFAFWPRNDTFDSCYNRCYRLFQNPKCFVAGSCC